MIPLVRPNFPDFFMNRWRDSTRRSGQFSNFGPLWHQAADVLTKMHGRKAFPCSSGTDAVALGLAAMGEDRVTNYEAFTFEATGIAARRLGAAMPIGTNTYGGATCVRTMPYGRFRASWSTQRYLVVDAAGGFGTTSSAFCTVPEDAAIAVSFHATKGFPIGEGGCLFLPLRAHEKHAYVMAAMNFGFDSNRNVVTSYATNAKLDELHCALLLAQLERGSVFRERSRRIREHSGVISEECPERLNTLPYTPGAWQSLVVVDAKNPDEVVSDLTEAGFTARRLYWPNYNRQLLTDSERNLVALPSDMSDSELEKLIEVLQ